MKISKILIWVFPIIYFPFISLIAINIIVSPYVFWNPSPFWEIILGFLIFSLPYLLFMTILRKISEKFIPYFTASFVCFYLISVSFIMVRIICSKK